MKNLKKAVLITGLMGLVLTSQTFAESKTSVVENAEILTAKAFDKCLDNTSLSPKALAKLMSLKNISGAFMEICMKNAELEMAVEEMKAHAQLKEMPKAAQMVMSPVANTYIQQQLPTPLPNLITSRQPTPNIVPVDPTQGGVRNEAEMRAYYEKLHSNYAPVDPAQGGVRNEAEMRAYYEKFYSYYAPVDPTQGGVR